MRINQLIFNLLLTLTISSFSFAQEIDTVTIEGEEVYVYPFKEDVSTSYDYGFIREETKIDSRLTYDNYLEEVNSNRMLPDSMVFTRHEFGIFKKIIKAKSYNKVKRLYFPKLGPMPTRSQFEMYIKMRRKTKRGGYNENTRKNKEDKYLSSKKFLKAGRANPYPFLLQTPSQTKDLIPVLDPIPDGKYIQYYESFCLVDEKGECQYISDRIAGYFTMKDNMLEGEATWVDLQGDTIKHGWFNGGLKTGSWKFTYYRLDDLSEESVEHYIDFGSPIIDTGYVYKEFANGSLNGEFKRYNASNYPVVQGHYKDDEKVGEWTYRDVQHEYRYPESDPKHKGLPKRFRLRDNSQITLRYTINTDDSLVVHPIVMRNGLVSRWRYDDDEYDFYPEHSLISLPDDKYDVAFEREEDLDYDEEKDDVRDYNDEYMFDDDFMFDEEYDFDDYSYGERNYYRLEDGKRISRAKAYDSIGAYPKYIGAYEAYYPNGQIAYKYDFDGGEMTKEPTVYWSNGKVHDEITFVADSNMYRREMFDLQGELFDTYWYDTLGKRVYNTIHVYEPEYVELDGFKMEDYGWGSYYKYNMADSLWEEELEGQIQLNRTWARKDSTLLWEKTYTPENRVWKHYIYSVNKTPVTVEKIQFSEDFNSWTGKSHEYFQDFEMRGTLSASFSEWYEMDSIPQKEVKWPKRHYDITSDYILLKGNEPYTGPLKLNLNAKKLAIKKGIVANLPIYDINVDKLEANVDKYQDSSKVKLPVELDVVNSLNFEYGAAINIFKSVAGNLLQEFFRSGEVTTPDYDEYYYYDYESEESKKKKVKKKDQTPRIEILEGYIQEGKPDGVWASYDQFGKKIVSVEFKNGEPHGRVEIYDYQKPSSSVSYYDRNEYQDTFPEKRTYYLKSLEYYENGIKEGKSFEYNWLGDIVFESEYKDGMLHGKSIERNNMGVTESEYKYGALDGYLRTYLTLPEQDSLLLYDLNFQEGMLQGESNSYHTNGNISKRGFFLSGQPIDDYEGFDSLGFRYHYVKFKYSYPIEEKIWEENELSVRYLFNWEDSIRFVPMDITESESLESLLYKNGIGRGSLYRPYYGRKRLVDKGGIDYQITKYYPNDTIARDGKMSNGRKQGDWDYYSYEGEHLYHVNYFDSIISFNDSIRFNSKGIYTELDAEGNELYKSYIIEKFERYDCSHSDHYETRQLMTISEANDSIGRMNGDVMNFYDNGTLQSAGKMKNGLPDGDWRFYDPNGKLNKYGAYVLGKRNGRWLSGDLSKTKYIGDICLNPNMPDIEEEIRYRENFLDIEVINYKLGKSLNRQYYDINMNRFIDLEEEEAEESIEELEEVEEE